MKNIMNISMILIMAGVGTTSVFADHRHTQERRPYRYRDQAEVIHVVPIVETVKISDPYQTCRFAPDYNPGPRHRSATPVIAGGIVGGLLGNQIGRGNGNVAATIAGVVLGSSIGHDLSASHYPRGVYRRPVELCETRYSSRYIEQTVGYYVTYRYDGKTYRTRRDQHPGAYISIQLRN